MPTQAVGSPETAPALLKPGEDLYFIAMPMETYKAMSDLAMKKGMTFAQAMQQALNRWTEAQQIVPQLLVEQGKETLK